MGTTDRSDRVYEHGLDATQKYDYFVAGVALTLVGYLGTQKVSAPLTWNPETLQLAATAILLGSAICGLKRIEDHVAVLVAMHRRLYLQEMTGAHADIARKGGVFINEATGEIISAEKAGITAEVASEMAKKATMRQDSIVWWTNFWGGLRDILLVLGLVALVSSRVLASTRW